MDPTAFRRLGHTLIDQIADYWENVEKYPVLSRSRPGQTAAALPPLPPAQPECRAGSEQEFLDSLLRDVHNIILPGITHWQHPGFFAYFSANTSPPAVLAELLSAGLGVQGMLWATSPACTELEQRMLDWLGYAIGLPEQFLFWPEQHKQSTSPIEHPAGHGSGGGVIAGTASESTLIAMLAAKARAHQRHGHNITPVVYTSSQAHSSVLKAAMICGIAQDSKDTHTGGMRVIPCDSDCHMDVTLLRAAMRRDVSNGRTPIFVSATVGTTGVTAVDPLANISEVTREYSAWLHVDAAHSGAACICPELRPMLRGIETADSFCFNPHKWLLTNFDCGCLWVADRAPLIQALSVTPEYLRNAASDAGSVVDYRDWQIPLGRRMRALKLWFVMRAYGIEGLQNYIRSHISLAAEFESLVRGDDRFEITNQRTVNLVCLRLKAGDAATKELITTINNSGEYYVTHTVLPLEHAAAPGMTVLRVAISGTYTKQRHVLGLWDVIRRETSRILSRS